MDGNENYLEKLKKYFRETPMEKVLEDWKKSEKADGVGISVENLISHHKKTQKNGQ